MPYHVSNAPCPPAPSEERPPPLRDTAAVIDVAIDDRMYLIDEQTLLNESILTKFGLRVGELTLVIRRLGEADGW